jgi:hypothetical protein
MATVSLALVVMVVDVGETESQVALSVIVSVTLLVQFLVMDIVLFGGFVAPCTA